MFRAPVAGWADLVFPGTSYLERDGTYMNLEGRLQRLRRAVIPPCPDELAWIAEAGGAIRRRDLAVPAAGVRRALRSSATEGSTTPRSEEHASLPPRSTDIEPAPKPPAAKRTAKGKGLRLLTYRPLFSGPAVDRVPELQFQRPGPEIELSPDDARKLGVDPGSTVRVGSNGTSIELRARVNKKLVSGVVRIPVQHAQELGTHVEVST